MNLPARIQTGVSNNLLLRSARTFLRNSTWVQSKVSFYTMFAIQIQYTMWTVNTVWIVCTACYTNTIHVYVWIVYQSRGVTFQAIKACLVKQRRHWGRVTFADFRASCVCGALLHFVKWAPAASSWIKSWKDPWFFAFDHRWCRGQARLQSVAEAGPTKWSGSSIFDHQSGVDREWLSIVQPLITTTSKRSRVPFSQAAVPPPDGRWEDTVLTLLDRIR